MMKIVCHMEKMKKSALGGLCRESKNADYRRGLSRCDNSKIDNNYSIVSSDNFINSFNDLIKKNNITNFRNNSVCDCSFMLSASPSFFADKNATEVKQFFYDCYNFIASKYGKDNIIDATVHLDEKTPHMHLELIPIVDDVKNGGKKLCARDLFGTGKRGSQLHELQEELFSYLVKDKGYNFDHHEDSRETNSKHIDNLVWVKEKLTAKNKTLSLKVNELDEKRQVLEKDNENIIAPKDRELFIVYNFLDVVLKKLPLSLQKSFLAWFDDTCKHNATSDKTINKLRNNLRSSLAGRVQKKEREGNSR